MIGGAGITLVATSLVLGTLAHGKWNDVKKLCGGDLTCDRNQAAEGHRLADAARLDGNIATGLLVGGAAALGVGAYLWFSAPVQPEHTTVRFIRSAGSLGVGLALQVGF